MKFNNQDCIFCKIVQKTIPSGVVYEDNCIVAVEDVNPQAPTHIVIISKKHIDTILSLDCNNADIVSKMVLCANKIARERNISEKGYRVLMNCNRDGGQTVFHIHMHLLGGRAMQWPPG